MPNILDKITNTLNEYVTDAKNIKGTYVVVDSYEDLANLPVATVVEGSLAYCVNSYTDTSVTPNVTYNIGFYQYNGLSWEATNIGGGGVGTLITEVTYSQFVSAINNSQLIPGMKYRITDYVTKINGVYDLTLIGQTGAYLPYATSAEHQFDLIVTALTTNTYDENVIATLHDGDTYFSNNGANLGAWELKWTHLNDPSKYSFADLYNGKGIITYMKDEFNNEAYYDFKNIQFLQFALKRVNTGTLLGVQFEYYLGDESPTRFGTLFDVFLALNNQTLSGNLQFDVDNINYGGGEISPIQLLVFISDISKATLEAPMNWTYMLMGLSQILGTTVTLAMLAQILGTTEQVLSAMTELQVIQQFFNGDFYYTFDLIVQDDPPANFVPHYDLSTLFIPENDMYGGAYCHDNKLGHCADALTNYLSMNGIQIGVIPNGLNCNTFQMAQMSNIYINCWGNTFGSNCFLNVFGGDCYSNKTENYFYGNKLAKQSWFNCFKNNCYVIHLDGGSNIFGNDCSSMFIQNSSEHNCFGNYCSLMSLLYCKRNLFGNGVNEVIMDTCNDNIIGNSVQYIEGNQIYSSTFGNNCTNIVINVGGHPCQAIFENKVSHIEITTSSFTGQFKICQGVIGSDINTIQIVLPSGSNTLEIKANNTTEVILL